MGAFSSEVFPVVRCYLKHRLQSVKEEKSKQKEKRFIMSGLF